MANEAFKIEGLEGVLKSLQDLPKEISQKRGGPVRTALRKGANVIRAQAQANVRHITATPNVGGGDYSTGLLAKSIKVVKGRAHKTLNGERMFVLVPKRARYPISKRTPTGIPVVMVGRMLEYGFDVTKKGRTFKRDPMPWMGPAFHAKKTEAVNVTITELKKGIDKAVEALSRKNR